MCFFCDRHVSFVNGQNAHNLMLHVRHIEMSQASDWPNHTGNHPESLSSGQDKTKSYWH